MQRLRAALLGCLLTGGVIFGARPVLPQNRMLRPIVYAAGPGEGLGRTPDQLARWFQPIQGVILVGSLVAEYSAVHEVPSAAGRAARSPVFGWRRCVSRRTRGHR